MNCFCTKQLNQLASKLSHITYLIHVPLRTSTIMNYVKYVWNNSMLAEEESVLWINPLTGGVELVKIYPKYNFKKLFSVLFLKCKWFFITSWMNISQELHPQEETQMHIASRDFRVRHHQHSFHWLLLCCLLHCNVGTCVCRGWRDSRGHYEEVFQV